MVRIIGVSTPMANPLLVFSYASCAQLHFKNQIKLLHLDGSACFLKLANHKDVASCVDQTDVGFLKMGSNFFSVGGVWLEKISKSKRICTAQFFCLRGIIQSLI